MNDRPMYFHAFKEQYGDQDFSLIADTVKKYFPVDQAKRLTPEAVESSPGFKAIGRIVDEEFLDQKAYRAKWGKLTSHLKKAFKKPVHGQPDLAGQGGCGFLGEVIIEEDKKPDFIRQKSLKFYVSILGPFFSIHGVDSSVALLEIGSRVRDVNKGNFAATHAITISPVFEYQEAFIQLEDELRSFFPGYLFVPYEVGMSTIKNVSVADETRDTRSLDTVYEALFGTGAVHHCLMRGDRFYGLNDWTRPLNEEEKALLDLISLHVTDAPGATSIHKVWKLEQSKRLDTFTASGNLMFCMHPIDVIDLTDKSNLIMMSKDDAAPSTVKYKIRNEVIEINQDYSLRIVELSEDRLTLNMILNFENEGVALNGEVLEMKFVQMKDLD